MAVHRYYTLPWMRTAFFVDPGQAPMKIYTRRGDEGNTGLLGGARVAKDHPRLRAYGTVDELSSCLGVARGQTGVPATAERLVRIQQDLFAIGASLARAPSAEGRRQPPAPPVPVERVGEMEAWMDEADADLPPLRNFILPGGTPAAAALHLARAVCRRAERATVALAAREPVGEGIVPLSQPVVGPALRAGAGREPRGGSGRPDLGEVSSSRRGTSGRNSRPGAGHYRRGAALQPLLASSMM